MAKAPTASAPNAPAPVAEAPTAMALRVFLRDTNCLMTRLYAEYDKKETCSL
ncbi:hypothetical protein [Novosphingobium malaysiense]|uniref:hypothetical protein n=1 Tax=Novosphingobium malaysiense TaxID=1348853 RepID=UPI0012E0B4A7|nr:hypothetical protein [Novosphingobium malaysiense]